MRLSKTGDLSQPLQCALSGKRQQALRGCVRSVQEDEIVDSGLRDGRNISALCGWQLYRLLPGGTKRRRLFGQFRKQRPSRFSEAHLVGISRNESARTIANQTGGIVAKKFPAAARARISKS